MSQPTRTAPFGPFLTCLIAGPLLLTYWIVRFIFVLLLVLQALAFIPCVLLTALELRSEWPLDIAADGPSATEAGMTGAEFLRYKARRMIAM